MYYVLYDKDFKAIGETKNTQNKQVVIYKKGF